MAPVILRVEDLPDSNDGKHFKIGLFDNNGPVAYSSRTGDYFGKSTSV